MFVYKGQRGIRARKTMVVHLAINVAGIVRGYEWHMAIGTFLGTFRVIE